MAKSGLEFYRVDTNRYQDLRLKRLKKEHRAAGIAIYDYILAEIYRVKGAFLIWDEHSLFDVADYFDEDESLITSVVECCCKVGLFDQALLAEKGVLSSRSIQFRYLEMCARMKRQGVKIPEEYQLLPEEKAKIPEERPKIHAEISILNNTIPKKRKEDEKAPSALSRFSDHYLIKRISPKNCAAIQENTLQDELFLELIAKQNQKNLIQSRQLVEDFFAFHALMPDQIWHDQSDLRKHILSWIPKNLKNGQRNGTHPESDRIGRSSKAELADFTSRRAAAGSQ